MQVGNAELIQALHSSVFLDVDIGEDGSCWVRRKQPYQRYGSDGRTGGYSQQGKGKGKNDSRSRGAPEYDGSTPCGYYMAGHCRRGDRCGCQHSVPYAMAIRDEWLHPQCNERQQFLQETAASVLGDLAIQRANLFPRVFSHRLELSRDNGHGWPHKRRWTKGQDTVNDSQNDDESQVVFVGSCALEERQAQVDSLRYLLVLDLEGKDEIIEFPVIVLDAISGCEVARFQRYVRPVHLFDGCEINSESPAISFTAVLQEFDKWLSETIGRGLDSLGDDAAFLTCGDWDCRHIHQQCKISGIPVPSAFKQWVNIKRTYEEEYGGRYSGMRSMLAKLKLLDAQGHVVHGFHHLGMHDVENIGRCVLNLLREGRRITVNGHYKPSKAESKQLVRDTIYDTMTYLK